MAGPQVSDHLLERLRAWGVERVFGYPGDGINGLLAAWGRAGNQPVFIQARHEEMAAFEAVGYAKFTGRVGVCAATSGPGAIHLLNGLYDAKARTQLAAAATERPDGSCRGVRKFARGTSTSGFWSSRRRVDLAELRSLAAGRRGGRRAVAALSVIGARFMAWLRRRSCRSGTVIREISVLAGVAWTT